MSETPSKDSEATIDELYQTAMNSLPAQQTPASTTEPVRSETLPDPVTDPDAHVKAVDQRLQTLQQELAQDRQERQSERQKLQAQTDERDFRDAVSRLAEKAGVPDNQKDLAEGFLLMKASKSDALQGLWKARGQNPESFNKALDALVSPLRDALSIKEDSQVAENQRALDDALKSQTNSEPPAEKPEDRLMKLSDTEFEAEWNRIQGRVW